MNNTKLIVISIIIAVMCSLSCRSMAINGDKVVRTNSKYYPKHYAIPSRWLRRLFSLPKRDMAKYFVFHLYLSLMHIAVGIINVVILSLGLPWSTFVFGCIIMFVAIAAIIDSLGFVLFLCVFKYRKD